MNKDFRPLRRRLTAEVTRLLSHLSESEMIVLRKLIDRPASYVELQAALGGVGSTFLNARLKSLIEKGFLRKNRQRFRRYSVVKAEETIVLTALIRLEQLEKSLAEVEDFLPAAA